MMESAIVRVYASSAEMRSSYATIRARFRTMRASAPPPPIPEPADGADAIPEVPERYVIRASGAIHAYDVVEGHKLNDKPLRKTQALELLKAPLSEQPKPPAPPPLRIEDIQRAVARHYQMSRIELLSQRRTIDVVRPRQIAMYLAKKLTLRSMPDIGRRFADRDHTTVLHAIRKIEALIASDPKLADEIGDLRTELVLMRALQP